MGGSISRMVNENGYGYGSNGISPPSPRYNNTNDMGGSRYGTLRWMVAEGDHQQAYAYWYVGISALSQTTSFVLQYLAGRLQAL